MEKIYIARQPIYDQHLEIVGYELLYRNSLINVADIKNSNQASSDTIVNSFINIGIDNLVGTALAFVNLPSAFILNIELLPIFHEQSVLEILEDVNPTPEIIEGIKALKDKGYKIALDDFVYDESKKELLSLADYIKVDVLDFNEEELEEIVTTLKAFSAELIAEKVETQTLFKQCKALGFDYFQGFFFCQPQMVSQKNLPANKMVVLSLIEKILNPEAEIDEIEAILSNDIALSYKLLRYINSAAFSLRREIESIKDAIVLLGLSTVRNWASLILMSRVIDGKPKELVVTALIRAKMSEYLLSEHNVDLKKQAFITGLFSVLDALMDKPMIDLLDTVILSTSIKLALLDYEGELGQVLKNVIAYEKADFQVLHRQHIDLENYYTNYLKAIEWAEQTMKEID